MAVGVPLIAFGNYALALFGTEFAAAHPALAVIAAGEIISCAAGSVGYFLVMTGHQHQARNIEAAMAALLVVSGLILIPNLGIMGAALATAGSGVVRTAALFFAVWWILRVRSAPM
jgi:O-antigen/teichoic acid export membrane protein